MNTKQLILWRRTRLSVVVATLFAALTTLAPGQTLRGTVTDATTKMPSAEDEIVLLDFSSGIQQLNHTRSDSKGRFTLELGDPKKLGMLRVIHQATSYYKVVPPGTREVHLEVYDVSKKLKDIVVTADLTRFQVKEGSLQAVRLFAVQNNSAPPRTQMSDRNFEFYLPEGAQIDNCMALSAGGQPVRTFPLSQHEKNRYAFIFPLRPGETQFQVLYHMPYTGEITINPRPVYGVEHFVVMLPKQMQFAAHSGAQFKTMRDPRQNDAIVQVASNTTVGQPLAFTLSGTGALRDAKGENAEAVNSTKIPKSGSTARDAGARTASMATASIANSSGRSQWYVLGGLGLLIAAGTISIARRSKKRKESRPVQPRVRDDLGIGQTTSNSVPECNLTLDDLKDQLFWLEVGHKQQRISQSEYERALGVLRQNLQLAIRTDNSKMLNSAHRNSS